MKIQSLAKYIDQPIIINNIQKAFPSILIGSAVAGGMAATAKAPEHKKKEAAIKSTIILSSTVLASLVAARGLKIGNRKLLKGLMPLKDRSKIFEERQKAINNFIKQEPEISAEAKNILTNLKNKALSPKEIDVLDSSIQKSENSRKLYDALFSPQAKLTSKGLFEDMKRLPQYGAYAIGGGLLGGLLADKITGTGSKKSTANKVKEACYQYFANTFLCITGAGVALAGLERLEHNGLVKNVTPMKKMATVIGGILGVGVIFGSIAANLIGKKVIDPMFGQKESAENKHKIYSERHPELLDICIHADDLATAGVYSGFKWVEAIMPVFYLIAGYRAGIGHRNNIKKDK